MTGDGLLELRRQTTLVRGINPRGARHGAQLRAAKLVCGRSVWILTMMQSCASAAKLRAAGPFFRSALSARFEYGFPPPRIVDRHSTEKTSASAEWC